LIFFFCLLLLDLILMNQKKIVYIYI
jgi:hypothetical protein